jgi:hypothetical protein
MRACLLAAVQEWPALGVCVCCSRCGCRQTVIKDCILEGPVHSETHCAVLARRLSCMGWARPDALQNVYGIERFLIQLHV